jgi:hypothetical protein
VSVVAVSVSWLELAACGGRVWYPRQGDAVGVAVAKTICKGCPVREASLYEALLEETDQAFIYGVRGGLTASERRMALANSERPPDGRHEFAGRLRVS